MIARPNSSRVGIPYHAATTTDYSCCIFVRVHTQVGWFCSHTAARRIYIGIQIYILWNLRRRRRRQRFRRLGGRVDKNFLSRCWYWCCLMVTISRLVAEVFLINSSYLSWDFLLHKLVYLFTDCFVILVIHQDSSLLLFNADFVPCYCFWWWCCWFWFQTFASIDWLRRRISLKEPAAAALFTFTLLCCSQIVIFLPASQPAVDPPYSLGLYRVCVSILLVC